MLFNCFLVQFHKFNAQDVLEAVVDDEQFRIGEYLICCNDGYNQIVNSNVYETPQCAIDPIISRNLSG